MREVVIWTVFKRTFALGGGAYLGGFKKLIPDSEVIKLSEEYGISGFILTHNDTTIVVELSTGGIVGNSLKQVQSDIASSTKEECLNLLEIQKARIKSASIKLMSEDDFWKIYCR